ncbi:MAG: alpha/beta hydrolase family protein [Pirellulales bacterium]
MDAWTLDYRPHAVRWNWRRWVGAALCVTLVKCGIASPAFAMPPPPPGDEEGADDMDLDRPVLQNMNWVMPTMGGKQLWTDERVHGEFHIQRNVLTGHYRLLDESDRRLAWGTWEQCEQRFREVLAEQNVPPVRGKVVVLLHGLGRSRAVVKPMADYLQKEGGYTTLRMTYASTREGVDQHADALRKVVDYLQEADEISFVGHSLGNIVVRHYLADEIERGQGRVRMPLGRVVMLTPPNNGAVIAKRLHSTGLFAPIAGKAGVSLGREWDQFVGRLATPPCDFGIVAGGRGNEKGNNPLLPGDDDLVVTVEETRLAGARDFLLVPNVHSGVLRDSEVQAATLRFLQQGCFRADGKREPIDE